MIPFGTQKIQSRVLLAILCLACAGQARSFIGVTTWPSFRLGNDLGRFDWHFDLGWSMTSERQTRNNTALEGSSLTFEPALGCNVALRDTGFTAYVGGMVGTWLRFDNGEYSDETNVRFALGGGLEIPLLDGKVCIVGEYLLGFWASLLPDQIPTETRPNIDRIEDHVRYGFSHIPSLQVRYFVGP
jgi:hypothetical protein